MQRHNNGASGSGLTVHACIGGNLLTMSRGVGKESVIMHKR